MLVADAIFLGLDALANHYIFSDLASFHVPRDADVDKRTFAGAFVVGMSMFATLFLGVVLAVFLTLGAVSGDAERGLLQPLVVRPIGARRMLFARFLAAAGVCAVYVFVVYIVAVTITGTGGLVAARDRAAPALLAAAVVLMTAMSLLGSVFLGGTANGIAIFMLFIAGLVAGLLGSIGHALGSHTISRAATIASWVLPFEALYQDALKQITIGTHGFTEFLVRLGPFRVEARQMVGTATREPERPRVSSKLTRWPPRRAATSRRSSTTIACARASSPKIRGDVGRRRETRDAPLQAPRSPITRMPAACTP